MIVIAEFNESGYPFERIECANQIFDAPFDAPSANPSGGQLGVANIDMKVKHGCKRDETEKAREPIFCGGDRLPACGVRRCGRR
jgi:hypothetical protein